MGSAVICMEPPLGCDSPKGCPSFISNANLLRAERAQAPDGRPPGAILAAARNASKGCAPNSNASAVMRNFVSNILAGVAPARLFQRPRAGIALARERLPFLSLLTALAAMVFSWIVAGGFDTLHHPLDGQSLAVASNLSHEHRFLMFLRQYTGIDGELRYEFYNRFPIGTYLLIKAVAVPFGDSAPAQIFAARLLTAAFFSGAAAFAYFGLRRLTNRPWIALAATLLAFSSYHALFYGDMISSEVSGLFGMMLTFHGMTVFVQEGRFRQLLIKALGSVLLGWIVMALLLPFTAFGLASAILGAMREGAHLRFADKARAAFAAVASSGYLRLGAASLLFCALVMGFNIANEYIALGGEVPLLDLPSVRSMLRRTAIDDALLIEYYGLAWLPLIELQFERIGGASLPYLALPALGHDGYGGSARDIGFWIGVAVSAVGLIGAAFTRRKILAASLLLAGWIWALAVPGSSAVPAHEFEALYHIGIPLVVFATALTAMSRWIKWSGIGAAAAAVALIAFGISLLQFTRFSYEDPSVTAANSDLAAIRKITQGANVCVGPMKSYWGVHRAMQYYLAGKVTSVPFACSFGAAAADQFIIEPVYTENDALLTPGNQAAFLYDARRLSESPHETALRELSRQEPVIKSNFSVYFDENKLIYAKEPCSDLDLRGRFFFRVRPVNNADLPPNARPADSQYTTFPFYQRGARFGGACLAYVILPDYPIERIRAGQFDDNGEIWSAFFVLDDAAYRAASAKAARNEHAALGYFNLHLQDGRLLFLRDPCEPPDAEARFFLHVRPVDSANLPQERKQYSFDNLNFNFDERGAIFDGKCAAIADLPAYPIERIRAGQFDDNSAIWSAFFVLDDAPYRAALAEAALNEPVARNHFDIHIQGDRLLFLREPCEPSDADARFFFHVHPVDDGDLPRERRQYGFDNLDFGFDERGARFDGKCAAIADLPAYPIERIRAGQIGGEGEIWAASIALREPG